MLPSILAKQLQKGIGDYIETTFPMTNEPYGGALREKASSHLQIENDNANEGTAFPEVHHPSGHRRRPQGVQKRQRRFYH